MASLPWDMGMGKAPWRVCSNRSGRILCTVAQGIAQIASNERGGIEECVNVYV